MERLSFISQLENRWSQDKFVCLGLDPVLEKLPQHLNVRPDNLGGLKDFLIDIIDSTADLVCAYKPNLAFYEEFPQTELILEEVVTYIHNNYKDIPVIADAKRGDIANTNAGYARSLWNRYKFDATTVHSYLGSETYPPFLQTPGKGIIAMCKTSNPDAPKNQDLIVDLSASRKSGSLSDKEYEDIRTLSKRGKLPYYQIVAYRHGIMRKDNPNIGIVVGATHPESFKPVRKLYGDGLILIPGIGTQGGSVEKTLKFAPNSKNQGIIINSGSAITFASSGRDFAKVARDKTIELHSQIVNNLKNR